MSRSIIDGPLKQIEWIEHNGIVYALTMNGTLYRSEYDGHNFTIQHLPQNQPKANIQKIIPVPGSSQVYFLGTNNSVWKTPDAGETYQYHLFQVAQTTIHLSQYPIVDILPHPLEPNWALAIDSEFIPNMFFTKDFGANWFLLSSLVSQHFWPSTTSLQSDNPPVTGAYILGYVVSPGTNLQTLKSRGLCQLTAYDSTFQNYAVYASDIHQLSVFGDYLTAIIYPDGSAAKAFLQLSADGGQHWKTASFVDGLNITNKIVEIIDISSSQMFVSVSDARQYWSTLYSASLSTLLFSPVQRYVLRANNRTEVVGIPLLPGAYLSTRFDGVDESVLNSSNAQAMSSLLETSLTYTHGTSWEVLTPPSCPDSCDQGMCSLHIESFDDLDHFLAPPTAVGLIMASANQGCQPSSDHGLYISRDGGWTWDELSDTAQAFDVADHAAFIVWASMGTPTTFFRYSTDYGATSHTCDFTSSSAGYQVQGFSSTADSTASSFILSLRNESQNVLLFLDFGNFFSRQCEGADQPGTPQSDYEFWVPTHDADTDCINGEKEEFSRRISTAQCYNAELFEPISNPVPCPCELHDYQCAPCYETSNNDCVYVSPCSVSDLYEPPNDCMDTWLKPSPYQKIPGDKCTGDLFPPTVVDCPSDSTTDNNDEDVRKRRRRVAVVFLFFCFIGFVIFAVTWLWRRRSDSRAYQHKKVEEDMTELSEL